MICFFFSDANERKKGEKNDAKQAETIWNFRQVMSTTTDFEDDIKAALEKLADGPIQCFIDPACCQVLEELSKKSMETLFTAKDAETSILIKRAPLVLGSDVSVLKRNNKRQRLSKNTPQDTPQDTVEWKAAAAKLLAEQKRLLREKVGDAWVILEEFDYGPQVLFALAQRQRTHGDGTSFFISGLLQFNMYVTVL